MIKLFLKSPFILLFLLVCQCNTTSENDNAEHKSVQNKNPNIILILADDLGYGDIEIYNSNSKIPTPNLNKLAESGIRFTDAHSSSSVCTPSRYSILTGEYAWRSPLKKGVTWGYSPSLIDTTQSTIASLLSDYGYNTAAIGKWHLGLNWPVKDGHDAQWENPEIHPAAYTGESIDFNSPIKVSPVDHGFDYFFGIPASLDMKPYCFIENRSVVDLPMKMIEENKEENGLINWRSGLAASTFSHQDVLPTLQQKTLQYLNSQKDSTKPFFLYYALTAPHLPILPEPEYKGSTPVGDYGDFVYNIDQLLGEIMNTLKENNQLENTIVIFTSDNGAYLRYFDPESMHQPNAYLRGQKADIHEGGHRVPLIISWPGKIESNTSSNALVGLTDFYSTFADIVSASKTSNEATDSYSLLPVLLGKADKVTGREFMIHHSSRGVFALRKDSIKLIEGLGSGGFTLPHTIVNENKFEKYQQYNLAQDSTEQHNIHLNTNSNQLINELEEFVEQGRDSNE
ncbi:sulfatase family protein [Marinigracilibium pacificum]|uniref:Arylsulfatase n=1 Tax=Marinigracilibium pacificum TaxID=2729599 RepID=A0A848IVK4_9BACT|nr:arylsulfatase [Marinigracilibium pacificum]NMM48367.1 arylsulfatase [Marinigracilibium pacificum]